MSKLREAVTAFLAERDDFVRALKGCPASNMEDYWRWQGHAEARRVFREGMERDGIDLTAPDPQPMIDQAELANVLREAFTADPEGATWQQAAEAVADWLNGDVA